MVTLSATNLSRICHVYCVGNLLVVCLVADVTKFSHEFMYTGQTWASSFYKKEKNILNIHFFFFVCCQKFWND